VHAILAGGEKFDFRPAGENTFLKPHSGKIFRRLKIHLAMRFGFQPEKLKKLREDLS